MQAIVRIRSLLSIKVPVRTLFDAPYLQQLAAAVEELRHVSLLEAIEQATVNSGVAPASRGNACAKS